MTTGKIILLSFYLLGCLLSYGRLTGLLYQLDEECIDFFPPEKTSKIILLSIISITLLSFIGLFSIYFSFDFIGKYNKYWFKWNKSKLWKQYYNKNK